MSLAQFIVTVRFWWQKAKQNMNTISDSENVPCFQRILLYISLKCS